ncbi:hypothetical protein CPC08DRAFT_762420 [Agrocybe pediades]|nr:hypothetical protein CPC08DRAFT_762420 [Agrocybe pediades]
MISSPLLPDVLRYCIDTLAQDIVRPLPGVTSGNPNYHALLNFRLVSKACNAYASSHVCKTIRITEDTRRTVRFIANLKGNPNLTKHIKSIEIYLVQRRGSDESCSGNAIKSLRVSALHPDEKPNRFSWKNLADEFIFELFRTTQNIYVSRLTRSTASFEGYKELHVENFFISELMDILQALITNYKPSIKCLTLRNVVFNHPSEEEKRFVATSPLFPDISLKSVPSPDFFCRKLSYAPSDISATPMSQFSDNFARPFSDLQELDFCVLDSRDRDFFDKIKKNFARKVHNLTINTTYFVTDPSEANGTKKGPRDHLFVLKDFPSLRSLRVTAHECPFGFLDDPTQEIISYNRSYCDIYFLPSLFEVNKPVPSLETIELTT